LNCRRDLTLTENTIITVRIKKIINECEGIKTFIFNIQDNDSIKTYKRPKPGQFVMIWVPGIDEIPMSISECDDKGNWGVSVRNVGECTKAMHELKINDFIGVRGPLGNYFKIPKEESKKIVIIGGGIGIAPLKFLSLELIKLNRKFVVIHGAKNENELIPIDGLMNFDINQSNLIYCTDDGSYGLEGFASDNFEKFVNNLSKKEQSTLIVFTCGPELMLYKIFKICEKYNIELQVSLERMMRCGCGLCGLCTIDPLGLLVCKDGPIFSSEILKKVEDFGRYKRDITGKKVMID
jgi:dihydroorotate dehydrogenase electron transfer subunit